MKDLVIPGVTAAIIAVIAYLVVVGAQRSRGRPWRALQIVCEIVLGAFLVSVSLVTVAVAVAIAWEWLAEMPNVRVAVGAAVFISFLSLIIRLTEDMAEVKRMVKDHRYRAMARFVMGVIASGPLLVIMATVFFGLQAILAVLLVVPILKALWDGVRWAAGFPMSGVESSYLLIGILAWATVAGVFAVAWSWRRAVSKREVPNAEAVVGGKGALKIPSQKWLLWSLAALVLGLLVIIAYNSAWVQVSMVSQGRGSIWINRITGERQICRPNGCESFK